MHFKSSVHYEKDIREDIFMNHLVKYTFLMTLLLNILRYVYEKLAKCRKKLIIIANNFQQFKTNKNIVKKKLIYTGFQKVLFFITISVILLLFLRYFC